MKKLMIAAAIALAAAGANAAAAADWYICGVGDSPMATAQEGFAIAYAVDGSKYASFLALPDAQKVAFFADSGNYYNTALAEEGFDEPYEFNGSKAGSWSAGQTASMFLVLFDADAADIADYYAVTSVQSGKIPTSGADVYLDFGTFDIATDGWQKIEEIPEPTSAMLMLLGMAGLALKRKRA